MANQQRLLITILLVGGILILSIGLQVRRVLPTGQPDITWVVGSGFLVFLTGLSAFWNKRFYEWFDWKLRKIGDWFGLRSWQVFLLLISPFFIVLASAGAGPLPRMFSPALAVISWILGVGLIFMGGYRLGEEKPKSSRTTILLMITISLIAFLFRGIATASLPMFLSGDEGAAGVSASQFISGQWNNIFIAGWYSFPSLFSFIQSLPIRLFGQTTEALRLLSAMVGTLTVTAVYLCGKAMFGNRAGILAALSLAALHFHVHFSRVGLNNIWDGLWYTITIGALWYGWERNRRTAYLVAGFALGIAQYFYVSGRGLIGLVLAAVMIALCFQHIRLFRSLPDLILMFALAIAVVFPLAWFYIHQPSEFLAPIVRVSFLRETFNGPARVIVGPMWKYALQQILIGLKAFTYTPILQHYAPETPILRPIYGTFFYIGLFFLFLRYRDSRLVLILFWLLTFGLIGGMSESAPASQRYVAAAPACALVVGLGVYEATNIFERGWPKYSKVATGLGYIMIAVAMISDSYFYYIEYRGLDQISNIATNGTIAQQLANRLKREPVGTQVAFFGTGNLGYYSIPSVQYLAPQVKGINVTTSWNSFDKTILTDKHIIFVFLPERRAAIDMITTEYPNGSLETEKAWNNQILFWIYDYVSK